MAHSPGQRIHLGEIGVETAHEQVSPEENSAHTALAKNSVQLCGAHKALGFTSAWPNGTTAPSPIPCDSTTRMLVYTRNFCQEANCGTTIFFFPSWHLLASWRGAILKLKYCRYYFCHFSVHICLLSNEAYSRWHHLYKITLSDPAYYIPMQLTLTFLGYGELNNVATGSDTYI